MVLLDNEAQVEASLSLFGIVLILTQDKYTIYAKHTISLGNHFRCTRWLGVMGHEESRFGPFGDSVSIGARHVHDLRQTYHTLRNHFGCTRWYS
jgi:hypothetical protein